MVSISRHRLFHMLKTSSVWIGGETPKSARRYCSMKYQASSMSKTAGLFAPEPLGKCGHRSSFPLTSSLHIYASMPSLELIERAALIGRGYRVTDRKDCRLCQRDLRWHDPEKVTAALPLKQLGLAGERRSVDEATSEKAAWWLSERYLEVLSALDRVRWHVPIGVCSLTLPAAKCAGNPQSSTGNSDKAHQTSRHSRHGCRISD